MNNAKRLSTVFSVIFFVGLCLPVYANGHVTEQASAEQGENAKKGRSVKAAIAKIEAQASRIDKDGDGILNQEEKEAKREKLGFAAGFVENFLDRNKDGILTVQEYIDVQVMELERADTNKDSYISNSEEKARKRAFLRQALTGR